MIIGGAAGATCGGIKAVRASLLAKGTAWRIKKILSTKHRVLAFKLGKLWFQGAIVSSRLKFYPQTQTQTFVHVRPPAFIMCLSVSLYLSVTGEQGRKGSVSSDMRARYVV